MSSGRIEMPLEEYNAMKAKIEEFEKELNELSKETSKYKKENESMKDILSEIIEMKMFERIFSWNNLKKSIENSLNEIK
jgi:hypothetical protein